MEEIKPTTTGSPSEDLDRYLENVRKYLAEDKTFEVRMPADYYAKLTPEQIEYAEVRYQCKIRPVKPIVFHSKPTLRTSKEEIFKTSSPKEYGMSLIKRKRR